MKRRETVSVNLSEIYDCIKKKIYQDYPYLKDENVIDLEYASNTTSLLFNVIRKCDIDVSINKLSDRELKEKGYTNAGIKDIRKQKTYQKI